MTAAGITFARDPAGRAVLAKRITVEGGTITGSDPAPQLTRYAFREASFTRLDELLNVLEDGARRGEIAVRGKPRAPIGRRAIYDDAAKGPAGLDVVPRRWVAFDWDGLPLDPIPAEPAADEIADDSGEWHAWAEADPLLDAEIGARHALRRLPPPFRGVSCVWQASASAGYKPGFRLRTWHILDHPVTGREAKTWLRPAIERALVDPVTLVEVQPHFLAVRVVGGPDPCPRRFGVLCLARDVVPVPDIEGIERRQRERERAARREADAGCPVRDDATAADYARQRIDDCLAAIRSATARHTAYKSEAARAFWICKHFGLDW